MNLEKAMRHVVDGKKIFRSSCPARQYFCKHEDVTYESLLLKMEDLMADDWEIQE